MHVFEHEIAPCDMLYEVLEEQSIYWNDDGEFVISMILKTIRSFREAEVSDAKIPPLYKDLEDADFVKELFHKTVMRHDINKALIDQFTSKWDVERIAVMDIILLELALTEATEMSSIPTKVSINEYIEISKYYSTNKSNIFINGVVDKIVHHLKAENKIKKTGRGLIGENNS
jgi:transcription antitermination protein NusB